MVLHQERGVTRNFLFPSPILILLSRPFFGPFRAADNHLTSDPRSVISECTKKPLKLCTYTMKSNVHSNVKFQQIPPRFFPRQSRATKSSDKQLFQGFCLVNERTCPKQCTNQHNTLEYAFTINCKRKSYSIFSQTLSRHPAAGFTEQQTHPGNKTTYTHLFIHSSRNSLCIGCRSLRFKRELAPNISEERERRSNYFLENCTHGQPRFIIVK